ncbi:hypothetical protein ABE527_12170 [Brucella sp. TWI432]
MLTSVKPNCESAKTAARAFPILIEWLKMLYLFVFTHYPTQSRFALLLEMLQKKRRPVGRRFHL